MIQKPIKIKNKNQKSKSKTKIKIKNQKQKSKIKNKNQNQKFLILLKLEPYIILKLFLNFSDSGSQYSYKLYYHDNEYILLYFPFFMESMKSLSKGIHACPCFTDQNVLALLKVREDSS